jgi:predicted outer membrane repeat protein
MNMKSTQRRIAAAAAGSGVVAMMGAPLVLLADPAGASTFEVTSLFDDGSVGTLRWAIEQANNAAGSDVVGFNSSLVGPITLDAARGPIPITDSINISGPGQSFEVKGTGTSIFYAETTAGPAISVEISGLALNGAVETDSLNGGSIRSKDANLKLKNVNLYNGSVFQGGGLYATGGSAQIDKCFFADNTAKRGGAIYSVGTDMTITDTHFETNRADWPVSAVVEDGIGGAIHFSSTTGSTSTLSISDSNFDSNSADHTGANAYIANARSNISGTTFNLGDSLNGAGGIHLVNSDVSVDSSTFSGNSVEGGGILAEDGKLDVQNSTISGGYSNRPGAALDFRGTTGQATIRHSTVTNNGTYTGSIVRAEFPVVIENSVISGNRLDFGSSLLVTGGGSISITTSLIEATSTGVTLDAASQALVGKDARLGPLGSNGGTTQTHLPGIGSPLIDAGDGTRPNIPKLDQRGEARIQGSALDIGAVEVTQDTPVTTTTAAATTTAAPTTTTPVSTTTTPSGANPGSKTPANSSQTVPSGTATVINLVAADGTKPTSVEIVRGPAHGRLVLNPDGTVTYVSNRGYVGADSFSYRATYGNVVADVATVNLTVVHADNARNDTKRLAFTGRDTTPLLLGGLGSLAAGLALWSTGRRRNVSDKTESA